MRGGYLCIVYVSEGLRGAVISRLKEVAATCSPRQVLAAHSFQDEAYNRTSFYLLSRSRRALIAAALTVSREAFREIDFATHQGTHPSLGAVDHFCFSPLGSCGGDTAKDAAIALGREFGQALQAQQNVNVYFYGGASSMGRSLRDIRKELGYFEGEASDKTSSLWDLVCGATMPPDLPVVGADEEQEEAKVRFARLGVSCVGVVPLVRNFNMRFSAKDAKALVVKVASEVREPGSVEALTLPWRDCFEVACNLRSSAPQHSPAAVLARAQTRAQELGLTLELHYTTGPGEDELLQMLADNEDSGAIERLQEAAD